MLAGPVAVSSTAVPRPKSSSSSKSHKANNRPKTVHVKAYTKKNGAHVKAYDRAAPQPK
jgi:hypothetical protein